MQFPCNPIDSPLQFTFYSLLLSKNYNHRPHAGLAPYLPPHVFPPSLPQPRTRSTLYFGFLVILVLSPPFPLQFSTTARLLLSSLNSLLFGSTLLLYNIFNAHSRKTLRSYFCPHPITISPRILTSGLFFFPILLFPASPCLGAYHLLITSPSFRLTFTLVIVFLTSQLIDTTIRPIPYHNSTP